MVAYINGVNGPGECEVRTVHNSSKLPDGQMLLRVYKSTVLVDTNVAS